MLQQTTVKAVGPYYARFLARWPSVRRSRRRRSTTCSRPGPGSAITPARAICMPARKVVVARHGGRFPGRPRTDLRALPGIGAYTAAAIAAIAFDRRAVAIDGNIERVIARLYAIETALPAAKAEIRRRAEALVPARRAGDFTQAMMDLGATICTPKKPACAHLPVDWTPARRARAATPRPFRARRRRSRASCATARRSWSRAPTADVLVRTPAGQGPARRHDRGALDRLDARVRRGATRSTQAPLKARWRRLPGVVEHGFTHFPLQQAVYVARVPAQNASAGRHALGGARRSCAARRCPTSCARWWRMPDSTSAEARRRPR